MLKENAKRYALHANAIKENLKGLGLISHITQFILRTASEDCFWKRNVGIVKL